MFGNPPKSPNHSWLISYQKGSGQESPGHQSPDWQADGKNFADLEIFDWESSGRESPNLLDDNFFS
jgi:hypothetical protein